MSITYPRALPSAHIAGGSFEIDHQEAFAPEHGGRFVSMELGWPLWTLNINTTPPTRDDYDAWRAWFSSLRGSGRLFYGRDVRRGPYPRRYPNGFAGLTRAIGGAFDGTSDTWEPNEAGDSIEIEKLPANFILGVGDYIGLRWGIYRSLHRVLAQAQGSSGGIGEWTVEPTIHWDVPVDAMVNLIKPDCLMVVTQRSALEDDHNGGRRVAFEARQHLQFVDDPAPEEPEPEE